MSEPLTLIEKIATLYAVDLPDNNPARQGDFITIRPKHIMTHDNTSAVMKKFHTIGAPKVHNPRQPVFAIDHDIQNTSPGNLGKYAKIEKFAREQGVDFYPAGTGISHQVMIEMGYVTPASMVVGSDSHSNIYGAMNALGTPVVRTDAACIWATGTTWWKVPKVARVILTGQLQPGVVGKDIIITLCGLFNQDEVLNMAVEFIGPGIASLSMDQRMTIANMTTEWGALAGVFPFDTILRDYLISRANIFQNNSPHPIGQNNNSPHIPYTEEDIQALYANHPTADEDANYAIELALDLTTIIPHVSGPDHVKVMHPINEIEKQHIKINRAYLLSCVNARLEDLREAADIVSGKHIADHVDFYVAAASAEIMVSAQQDGTWQNLINSGATILPPGCGTCIGLGEGTLQPGEIGISATNRNFKGRMGSRDALTYLASPAVVAASALAGYICAPKHFADIEPEYEISINEEADSPDTETEIIPNFPEQVTGRALFLPVDNLNTDGIYAGSMTYRDNVTDKEMAQAAMANYDPNFNNISQQNDIIVSGKNFGTGSSREQAATCLALRGIQAVIAESFSETYRRNAFNNGFIVIECEGLAHYFHRKYQKENAATILAPKITIDYRHSTINCEGESFAFPPLSPTAQNLIVAGGAENAAKSKLNN